MRISLHTIFDTIMVAEQENGDLRCRVDRDDDIESCISGILAKEKILILGEQGVGKTFLLRSLRNYILENHKKILPIYFSFSPSSYVRDTENMSLHGIHFILQRLMEFIWKEVLNKNISALYDEMDSRRSLNKLESKVKKIYRLSHITENNINISSRHELEAQLFMRGGINKEKSENKTYSLLASHDIVSLFDELCEDLVKNNKVESIVFLCDEANNMNKTVQDKIEEGLFEILSTLPYTFVYVRSFIPECRETNGYFEKVVPLEGFPSHNDTKAFIEGRLKEKDIIKIDDEAYIIIHDACGGNPREIVDQFQEILSRKLVLEEKIHITALDASMVANENYRRRIAELSNVQ